MPAPLVAAIVRGVASQGIKKGITQGAKQFAKDKIKDVAKEKAKSFIKNKKDKDGGLVKKSDDGGSGGGFFGGGGSGGGGGGGSLIKSKKIDVNKLSLISNEKNDGSDKKDQSKPFTGEELIQELNKIKDNLVKLKEISSNNLANSIKNNSLLRKQREKAKRDEKEEKLESNKKGSEKPKSTKGVKGPGFLDLIWGFISNVLLGSLVVFLLKHAPTIIRMFEDIAKGLQNPLQQLRLGIITLTTLFPKQIKFLAKLTGKILGPPARLIGKLLLKASNVLGNLLKKAGIAILNLVKNPIKNLAKKILGQAGTQAARSVGQFVAKKAAPAAAKVAGKAVGAAGKAVNVLKRFKFLSKLFKRVPFIGALIGIGIDLAMGERIDVAVAGAAGASLGAAIGGAIGTGLIPIPIVGTWVGAGVGSAVGDWAGKEIYKNFAGIQDAADKEAPVDQKYAAGRIGSTVAAARSQGRSGQNPQSPPSESSTKLSGQTQENAEKNIFKDEKHLNVFSEIREKLRTSSFVGELLQLGADMAIGEKVNKTRTDIAAQQIGSSIGRALSENELQVFGFNKKLIGPFSEELTKWAKGKIFKDLTSISFPSYDKAKEESSSGTQPGQPGDSNDPGSSVGPGAIVTGGTSDFWAMAAVASLENSNPQGQADVAQVLYNRLASGKYTGKSIKELVIATNQFQPTREGDPKLWAAISDKQSAIAAVASHPRGRRNAASMVENAAANIKNPALQKSAAEFVGGRTDFSATGQYDPYPGAIGIVKRHGHDIGWFVGPGSIEYGKTNPGPARAPKLGDIVVSSTPSGGGGGSPDINRPTVAGSPTDGKNRKIFLHWSAGGYNTPFSAYHSIVLGSGKKVQNTPYDKDKSGHTAGGNTNSVGLAVAAAKGATENNLKTPPTTKQLDVMTSEAANLAKSWGWTPAKVDSNVKTHGEWERYAVPAGILPPPVQRWDLDKLSQSDRFGSGGPKLRDMIKSKMSAMGGGKGNGGAVKKHKASEFILGGGRTLTSGMGMRDFALSPGMHMGVDINGTTGEPLQAFSDGVVQDTGYEAGGYGNWVSWIDDNGIGHFYAHMNKPAFVRKGQRIKKGTILGELGSTGRSSGPHLHWETATNPSDTGRSKSAVLSRFNPLSKYGIDAPFGGTIQPDPSMATQGPPGASPGSPGAPGASPGESSPSKTIIDPNFKIEGSKVKEFYLQALRDGTYTGKPQNMQSVSQRTDSIMQTPAYANNGGNNVLVMPMGSPPQQSMPSGGRVNSGGGFVGSGDLDNYNKSLNQIIVSSFYKI